MTAPDPLAALCAAWLAGEDVGPLLHDLLEERGWPLEWDERGQLMLRPEVRDQWGYRIGLADAWYHITEAAWVYFVGLASRPAGQANTRAAARAAALAALRRALAGG